MKPFDSPQNESSTTPIDTISSTQAAANAADVAPPIGTTPPAVLARDAADGRRGAAWRLMVWVIENDPRAVEAVSSLNDDRLAENLLEFIAQGTWAGKPFVVPVPLRSAYARTRLRTLFLPGSGIAYERANRVLLAHVHDYRPAMRETVANILGIIGNPAATNVLIDLLHDPVPAVRLQAARALGRVGDPAAVPALLAALHGADEQLTTQIFSSLVKLGSHAVPALLQRCKSHSAWIRWNSIRALSEIQDVRAIPALVEALRDSDHGVAWMGAKGLVQYGSQAIRPVLELLMTAQMTPWLAETASYVLRSYAQRNADAKPILEPVVQRMRDPGYRVGTAVAAQKALDQLRESKLLA
jgi:hypothetical protein